MRARQKPSLTTSQRQRRGII